MIKRIKEQFGRLQKRQRTLVLALIAAILFSAYYNGVYKPQSSALRKAERELTEINNRQELLKAKIPDISKEKEALRSKKADLESLKSELISLEAELPTRSSVPQLLGELARQASGYPVDFISIRPKKGKDTEKYPELFIELKFTSTYSALTNYLNRLESLSQFLRATDITAEEMKKGFDGTLNVTLVLSTLLGGERSSGTGPAADLIKTKPISIKRSPFLSIFRPSKKSAEGQEFKLTGIISTGKEPTAIIDNEVYKIGDTIGGKKIKEILRNMVILTDGREDIVLMFDEEL